MTDPEPSPSPEGERFLEIVLGKPSRASVAAFVAVLRGERSLDNDPTVVAEIFGEANFNPNEPRDDRGRWTTGSYDDGSTSVDDPMGADDDTALRNTDDVDSSPATGPAGSNPPAGTRENGYDGVGRWEFKWTEEAKDCFKALLKPPHNVLPDTWLKVLQRGCVGLNMLRIGVTQVPTRMRGAFQNALFLDDTSLYANEAAAAAAVARLSATNPGTKYVLFAAQMPTAQANSSKIKGGIASRFGNKPFTVNDVPWRLLNLDKDRITGFNFATRMPKGYWEYLNHDLTFNDPKKLPAVVHATELPDMGKEYITVYGVTKQRTPPQ
jgi:hypothetical protein